MDDLVKFQNIQSQTYVIREGSVDFDEAHFLQQFVERNGIKRVLEIGFNGGLSSAAILSAQNMLVDQVTSFDIGEHECVLPAKKLIDDMFPNRHSLVIGNSLFTIPKHDFLQPYDLAFIDGGHTFDLAKNDILNCKRCIKSGGFIIIDDYNFQDVKDAYDELERLDIIKTVEGPIYARDRVRCWIVAQYNENVKIKQTSALCAIALDEEPYIEEWIKYNLKLGFDMIFIYDNSENNVLDVFNSERVCIIHFPGKIKQMEAYNHFISNYRTVFTWCAIIDCDEFIVLKTYTNINQLLFDHCQSGSLSLNWVLFGSNGRETYSNEPVLERFTRRQASVNHHVKTIFCMNDVVDCTSPHCVNLKNPYLQHDCKHRLVLGAFNYKGTESDACIFHFFTKSKEEFVRKMERGLADSMITRSFNDFYVHDINEIEDISALQFFNS